MDGGFDSGRAKFEMPDISGLFSPYILSLPLPTLCHPSPGFWCDTRCPHRASPRMFPGKMQTGNLLILRVPFFLFNVFNWRLITLQYCSGFCHALT